jgi:tetratricopeptide (TPR) repeat protein
MDIESSEVWKTRGNDLYRAKDYSGAVDAYSKAIEMDSGNASLYTNRAAAYLMIAANSQALADCENAIAIDGTNAKAYFRKSSCLKALGRLDAAISALKDGLVLDPTSNVAKSDFDSLTAAKLQIEELRVSLALKKYSQVSPRVEALIKSVGGSFRELNLLKAECQLGLGKSLEAYNLTNQMVRFWMGGDVYASSGESFTIIYLFLSHYK